MACFLIVFLSLSLLFMSAGGQAIVTCDQFNVCVNGVCELQTSQEMGCTCNPGFISDPVDPLQCHPIPSCNLLQGSPDQQCLNGICQKLTSGVYGCVCYAGYEQNVVNANICENVNECTLPSTGCAPGTCTDVIGDYSCTACIIGYTLDQRGKCHSIAVRPVPFNRDQGNQPQSGQNYGNSWMMWPWIDTVLL